MILSKFTVKNYRSLLDVSVVFYRNTPISICGENNIGKTNFLRAMDLYFNHGSDSVIYSPKDDIPNHIYYGAQGRGYQTTLIAEFHSDNKNIEAKIIFKSKDREYLIDNKLVTESEFRKEILSPFHFILIESNNINLPKLIATTLEKDGLLSLDSKRRKQSEPLKKLKEFIELSKEAIKDIEREINQCFRELTDFEGILKGKNLQIKFAEFDLLRDAVKNMTSITLFDGNNHSIANKGSGAQRAVFLSLMKYISKNIKDKNVIWGVDEPEVFLQPKLQKKVFNSFLDMSLNEGQTIIMTTHSQHFINLRDINCVNLFSGEVEEKQYKRRPGEVFYALSTCSLSFDSMSEKISKIKEQLGISSNDGWELLPFNILVEGETDKKYLELLLKAKGLSIPHIIWSGGASKIGGYLQYYNSFAEESIFGGKPKIMCVFDHDNEGVEQYNKVKINYKNIDVKKFYIPRFSNELNDKGRWEVEDFIPHDLIIEAANILLRKNRYDPINKKQITNRYLVANKDKTILDYLSECVSQNNPSQEPFDFNQEGRKKELCKTFCELFENDLERVNASLKLVNESFINEILGVET